MASKLFLISLLSLAKAQTTIITLPFIGYDNQPIAASIVGANHDATTLSLACVLGTDSNDCGLFPTQIMVVGPSMYNMNMVSRVAIHHNRDSASHPPSKYSLT
jgi:hypothetical protein